MTLGGVGPKLMLICLPYIILALSVEFKYPEFLNIEYFDHVVFKYLGLFWLAAGFAFWIASVIIFLTNFKKGKLITRGTFAWCRNPVYASMIVFILPAFALIYHSGLIASIALVFYISFKISIHGESILLKRTFGNEYEIYKQSVNEIFPFPRFIFKDITTTKAKE